MIRKKYINSFIFSSLFTFFIFSVEASVEEFGDAALTRNQALDFIWFKKLPENYLMNDTERGEKAIISAITVIDQRLTAHTYHEIDVNYNAYDHKFLRYSNYLIWGFVKYFETFSLEHQSYNDYILDLRTVLEGQTDYLARFPNELVGNQDSKYKTGIARGYLELAKLDTERKPECLESAWSYFSSISGNISKKNKFWQAEILYNGYIPEGMNELEAVDLAVELCKKVQKKKNSAKVRNSPKGGHKPEGIMPHYNYLNKVHNREKNMTLLNLVKDKKRQLNDESDDDDFPNNLSSDDSDDPSERRNNEFINVENRNEDNSDDVIINFEDDEFNDFQIGNDNNDPSERRNEDSIFNFEDEGFSINYDDIEMIQHENNNNNNSEDNFDDSIINFEDESSFEENNIIFRNNDGGNKKHFVIGDDSEEEEQNLKKNQNNNEIRMIVNIAIFQTPQEFCENTARKTISKEYWENQRDNIGKMLNAFQNNKVVCIKGKGNFSVGNPGRDDRNCYQEIAKIYGINKDLFESFHLKIDKNNC